MKQSCNEIKENKHAPVIESPNKVERGQEFRVRVTVGDGQSFLTGKSIEHHVRWIEILFQAKDETNPREIRVFKFSPLDEKPAICETSFTTEKPGTIFASSYCNLHGLLRNSKEILVKESASS
ncbi:MAG: desulfoferrodoxin family protein [Candidatus Omnitrophota bacterium]